MTKQWMALLTIGVLLLTLLTGCNRANQMMNDAGEMIDDATDIVDDAVTPDGKKGKVDNNNDSSNRNNNKNSEGYDTNTGENNAPINLNDTAGASSGTKISADEAKAIALSHLGVTKDQVTHLFAEYETDDGVPQYEVHFHKNGVRFDYEIHAETGKLLTFEQEDD